MLTGGGVIFARQFAEAELVFLSFNPLMTKLEF